MHSDKSEAHISVITMDGERFEGLLHVLDDKSNTVTLRNVRSFGTEGRKAKSGEIAPNPTVRNIVCFEGKNLQEVNVINSVADKRKSGVSAEKVNHPSKEKTAKDKQTGNAKKFTSLFSQPDHKVQKEHKTAVEDSFQQTPNAVKNNQSKDQKIQQHRDSYKKHNGNMKFNQAQPDGQPRKSFKEVTQFKSDFNFAEHNEKYEKLTGQLESLKVYDKSTSFFDNLSAKADQKTQSSDYQSNTRSERQKAKQVDTETFGSDMIASHRPRRYRRRYTPK